MAAALAAAARGYAVFPARADKRPYTKGWEVLATTDARQIREWWTRWPRAQIGLPTGDMSVVDLDVKAGHDGPAAWSAWCSEHGVPELDGTPTPSGGQHVYYRGDLGNRVGVLPGVDTRGAGGYVIAYNTPPTLAGLPQLPSAVAALAHRTAPGSAEQRHVGPEGVRAALARECDLLAFAEEGSRNHALNGAAYNLGQLVGDYLTEDEVTERLLDAALAIGLDADEAHGTITSGLTGGMANPRTVTAAASQPPGAWTPVDMVALLAGGLHPLRPTLLHRTDGLALLYPGRTHSISGESGSGKSWVAQWVTAQALRNGEAACYLDYESSAASVVERLRALGCSDEALARLVYINPGAAPSGAEFDALLARRFTVAVVDGVTEALALSGLAGDNLTNSNDAVTRWHAMLPKRVAEATGAAVIQVDHVTKAKDNRGGYAIGGQAKRASITGAAYVVRPRERFGRGRSGALDMYVSKDREGYVLGALQGDESDAGTYVGTLAVTCSPDMPDVLMTLHAPRASETKDDKRSALMERVSQFLAELPADHAGAGVRLIKTSVKGRDNDIADALDTLVAQGYVAQTTRGQSRLHTLVKAYIHDFVEDV